MNSDAVRNVAIIGKLNFYHFILYFEFQLASIEFELSHLLEFSVNRSHFVSYKLVSHLWMVG